jgi:hypothetical protein
MTVEEYLRQDIGQLVASLVIQVAMLKAERDQLKQQLERDQSTAREASR